MKSSKSTFRFEINNGYSAGNMTAYFCKEQGLETAGSERGIGWGATPAQARKRAMANLKVSGNVNVEWVLGHERLWKNGELISETF